MGIAQEYKTPDTARKRESWWPHIIGGVIAVGLIGLQHFADKGSPEQQTERKHIIRTMYSHPTVTYRVGVVDSVSFRKKPEEATLERKLGRWTQEIPEEWSRDTSSDTVVGSARLLVLGSRDGGTFRISYTYTPDSGEFVVTDMDDSFFTYTPPNFE